MYTIIESKKGKFQTYIIKNEELKASMEIIPERGGIVSSLVIDDKNILYLEESTLFDKSSSVHGGIPVLFPICGLLKDNRYNVKGNEFYLKRHGFARDFPWKVCEKEIHSDNCSITLKFESFKETLELYPYKFEIYVKYILSVDGLEVQAKVHNKSIDNMPFYMGFHPYFNVSAKENIDFDISYSSVIDEFNNGFKEGNINILNKETNLAFCYPKKSKALISDRKNHKGIEVWYDNNIKYLVLWTQGEHDFVCMEPWMAYVDAMNTGKDLLSLKQGEWFNMNFKITAV